MAKIFSRKFCMFIVVMGGLSALTMLLSIEDGSASGATAPDQCCSCHAEVCEQKSKKRYVHTPVLENHCTVCHVEGGQPVKQEVVQTEEKPRKMNWFARDCQEDDEHWFELPAQFASAKVELMGRAEGRKVLRENVELPSLDSAEKFPFLSGNPVISNLRIVEVKRGVFLSATIAWSTDRITDAQVVYGENSLTSSSALNNRWATEHEITVTGLAADKDYSFIAVSNDIYGNKVHSEEMALSTHDFFKRAEQPKGKVPQKVKLRARFFQQEDRLFAKFETNHPVAMRLGYNGDRIKKTIERTINQEIPVDHLEMTDPYLLTVQVCLGCHPQSQGVHSHPVDIHPKAGMRIPPEYSTMSDGRISCMSCHHAHSSDNEYRLTRANRKDLCLGCHRKFG